MESEDQEPLPAAPNIPWPPPPPPPSGQGTRRSLVNSGDAASSAPSPLPVMTPHQKRLDDQLLHLELELLDALQPPVPRTRRVSSGPRGQSMRSSLYAQSLPPVPEKPLKYQQHRNSSMKRLGMLIFISMSIVSLLIVMLVLTVPDCAPLTGCQLGTVYADLRAQLFSDATRFNSSNSMIVTWNAQTMQAYPQLSGLYQYVMQTRHDPFATAELTSDLLSIRLYNVTMPKSIGELPASLRFPSMHLDTDDDDDDGKLGVERKVGLGPPICGRLAPSSPVLGFRASSVLAHSSSSQNTKEVQSMNELISNHTNTALQGMDASSVSSVQSPTDWSARSPTPPLDTMAFCCLEVYAKEGDRWMMGGQARVQRHQVQGRFLCTSGKLIGGIWVGWSDLIKTAEEHQPMEPLSSSPAMVRRTTVNNDTSTPFSRSWLAKLRTGVEASQFQVGGQWWQPITGVQVATETVAGVTKGVSLVHAVAVPWTTWPFIDTLFREQNGTTLANMTMMSHLPFSRHPPMKRITLNDGRFRFLLRQQDIETSRLVPSPWLMYPFQGYFGGASLSLGGLSLPRMYKITLQQQPVWFLNATGCPVAYHRSGSFCWSPSLSSRDVEIQFKDEYRVQSFVGKKETKQPVILRVVRVQVLYRPVNVNLSLWNNKLRRVPHPIPKLPLEITIQRHWDFNQDVRRRRNHTRRMGRLFRLTDGAESIDTTNSLDLSEAPNRGAIWEELDDIHWKQVNRFTFNTNVRDGSLLFGYEMVRNSDPVMLTVSMPQSNDLIVPRSLVLVPQDQDQLTKQERRREGKTAGLYDWNQVLKYHAFLKTVVLSTFQTNVSNMDAYNSSMDRGVYAKLPSVSRLGELPLPYRNLNASIDVYMDSLLNSGRILYPKNPLAFELRSSVSSALELFTLPAGDGDRFVPKIRYGLYEWKEQTRVNDFYLQQLRRTFQSTMRYVSSFLNSKDVERNVSVLEYVVKQAHVIADLAQSLDNHIDGIPMERLIAFYQIMRPFADEFYNFVSNGVKVNAGLFKNVMIDWSTKTTSQNKAVTPPMMQSLHRFLTRFVEKHGGLNIISGQLNPYDTVLLVGALQQSLLQPSVTIFKHDGTSINTSVLDSLISDQFLSSIIASETIDQLNSSSVDTYNISSVCLTSTSGHIFCSDFETVQKRVVRDSIGLIAEQSKYLLQMGGFPTRFPFEMDITISPSLTNSLQSLLDEMMRVKQEYRNQWMTATYLEWLTQNPTVSMETGQNQIPVVWARLITQLCNLEYLEYPSYPVISGREIRVFRILETIELIRADPQSSDSWRALTLQLLDLSFQSR